MRLLLAISLLIGVNAGACELLIKAVSATHTNAVKDARGCYKRGDIVGIQENGWPWGDKELLAPKLGGVFVVVKITDVTKAQALNFVQTRWGCNPDSSEIDTNGVVITRRRIRLDIDLVPAGVRNTLANTGQYSTTWAAIKAYIIEKRTGQTL